ncbi:MAG: DNA-protecting protein DprA [Rhodospirillaceae bacterium]|nr:MAG: DNA-protecting protein DprA [Rhodospirillaceae bacterium]
MPATTLSRDDLIDWIRLIRTEGIGPVMFRQLVERFGAPGEVLHHLPTLTANRKRPVKLFTAAQAEAEMAAAARLGLTYITWRDPAYPAPLAAIDDAPPVLLAKGDATILNRPMIAIVGARNASVNGRKIAGLLAADLAKAGFVVISGLARGVDGAAHSGALRAGGTTVAVLAGGTDVIYPPEHAALHEQISAEGALISEMPPGAEPVAAAFPRRNRIISGTSRGVVVVEATPRSGSLITARFAADQGRDVFAVPGSPLDPRANGPNGLIRDGAVLVEKIDDILSVIGYPSPEQPTSFQPPPVIQQSVDNIGFNDTVRVLKLVEGALGPSPTAVDEVVRQCQVSPALVATALLELELAGRLERHPGNRVALIGTT